MPVFNCFRRSAARIKSPLQILLIRLEIIGVSSGEPLFFFARQVYRNCVGNFCRYAVFDGKNICEALVKFISPDWKPRLDADKLRRYAHSVTRFSYASFKHGLDVKFSTGGYRLLIQARIFQHRARRPHVDLFQAAKLGNQRIGHPDASVFARFVAIQHLERKNGY